VSKQYISQRQAQDALDMCSDQYKEIQKLREQRDELLAALEEVVAWFDSNEVVCYALDEAVAAIKKVGGE